VAASLGEPPDGIVGSSLSHAAAATMVAKENNASVNVFTILAPLRY
jgi:hypothetical protein